MTVTKTTAYKCSLGHMHEHRGSAIDCEIRNKFLIAFGRCPSGFYEKIGGEANIMELANLLHSRVYPTFGTKFREAIEYLWDNAESFE